MSRWSEDFEKTVSGIRIFNSNDELFDDLYIKHNYQPQTDQERQEFEEFSLIISAMALMIHVAETDRIVQPQEKQRIIDDMTFQLHQRHLEYDKLTEEFGATDRAIIANVFDQLVYDYEQGELNIDETVRIINTIFQHNPFSRNFLIRLCYYSALSDKELDMQETERINNLATQLHIDKSDQKRIMKEVQNEMRYA